MTRIIQIQKTDNVVIPTDAVPKGSSIEGGLVALDDIPQGHKIALQTLKKGDAVIRYGIIIGYLKQDVTAGAWINEYMLELPSPPPLEDMPWGTNVNAVLPSSPLKTFMGYDIPGAPYAGIRNILAIMPTVQCVSGVLNVAVERMKAELLPHYPNVDDIVPLNHAYGCGVAIGAREAHVWIRSLKNLLYNPNFGGEIMVVALGCEKLTPDMLLDTKKNTAENLIILQECKGFKAMVDALMSMAEQKLQKLNRRKRTELPLSKLCVGMQCGGSDTFSGVTSNPSAGYASDLLVNAGATVLFSEVTEVRDGVHLIAARCVDETTRNKLAAEMRWYDDYLDKGGIDRNANPTPGNKKGGLANIVEKAMGSIAKSGTAPVVEVLSPGERPSRQGLIYAATPASDIVCGPEQLASGIVLQVFMTGRGTPYGLAAAPVIKVSSRTVMKEMWNDLIDVNAGIIAESKETIEEVGLHLFNMIVDTASGRYKPWAEQYRLHNDLCIFNPAPIT
ncbi:putative galactarate dehydratase (L-threo-forming) [Spirochaetia bacterium]|nr:putative galactarate dehydratase (L-threo-forming) [Spirochaetia bacterium]